LNEETQREMVMCEKEKLNECKFNEDKLHCVETFEIKNSN